MHVIVMCKVCLLVCLLALSPNGTKLVRNSYEIRSNFARTNMLNMCLNTKVSVKFVRIYDLTQICANFVQFVCFIVALFHPGSPFRKWCLAHCSLSVGPVPHVVPGYPAPGPAAVCGTFVCKCLARTARRPTAPVVDGPRARPPVSAVRPPCARDTLRRAAARPARVRGVGRGAGGGDRPHAVVTTKTVKFR